MATFSTKNSSHCPVYQWLDGDRKKEARSSRGTFAWLWGPPFMEGVGANALRRVRFESGDGATRAHRPGLQALPLSRVRQAVQRAQRHLAEPGAVSFRRDRARGALAASLQKLALRDLPE